MTLCHQKRLLGIKLAEMGVLEDLAAGVGAADALLDSAARRVWQQALRHAHDLHPQLPRRRNHNRLRTCTAAFSSTLA